MDHSIKLYDEPSRWGKFFREFLILLLLAFFAVALAFGLVRFGTTKVSVTGKSMEATLQEQDLILVDRISYLFHAPRQNDVIVFLQNGREHNFYNIKRIIGLPGDTVQIRNGIVYVNDTSYEEVVNTEKILVPGLAEEPLTLRDEEYFVLGDNRNNSEDSRYPEVGFVDRGDIIGRAFIRLEPDFTFVDKCNLKED